MIESFLTRSSIYDSSSMDIDNISHLYFSFSEVRPSSILFKLIIEHCDINKLLKTGTTPLHCYLRNNHFDTYVLKELIIKYGMNTFNVLDNNGHLPLHKYLTHDTVDNDIFNMLSSNIDSFSKYKDLLVNYIYSRFESRKINYYVLYKLLRKGSDPNYVDYKGNNSLHYFCNYISNYDKRTNDKSRCEKRFIKELVKYGANVNKVNNEGNTPLHTYMTQYDHSHRIISTLLSLGADLRIQNNDHLTPIMEYLKCDDVDHHTLIMLINWYESKYRKLEKEEGQHLLYLFIKYNESSNLDVLFYLLKKFNMKNDEYYNNITPLHNACINCNIDIISYLVYIGCDINLPTKDNKSIFDIILTQKDNMIYRDCIIYYLIKHGLNLSLSVIKKIISGIPYFSNNHYVRYIIIYCILMNNNFIEEYNKQCSDYNYKELFVYSLQFDYIDNIVTNCVNDISRLKQENYYNILRYKNIKQYNRVNDTYVTNNTFPMYTELIKTCNICMKRKYKLINDVADIIHRNSDYESRLSLLPPEIISEIVSKLSEYNLNTILYGSNHINHFVKKIKNN
ncbi:ankyrin-repeat protein [Murmansk poxvirus]|uniref:Ankyrin-repeat protein n=1 Tax=Murmansk poxvirus TaxID=2025359 RepID=A0A223FMD7_9POXV|nr:ankyrin-repeat protein [Murmansk poxvirus]YP_009408386.1 ankyrin-repeat protein [Murmansk poxvirus]AST09198.1 ankyrin-repeat protein [Murmansk poxvirus]AST09399.1 ankyrin-repeat protein [Murmansk poxvirus]